MNKKFLSAILCGAMLVTAIGTFVSCKDYDDDIENLQSQIDGLSTSSSSLSTSLSSVQSTLESQLSSAQSSLQSQITSAQSALQSAIDNKADASEISTLATNLATLQQNYEATTATLNAQIAAAQTAIEALQAASSNAGSKETEEALQAAIDAANATLSALTGTVSDESKTREAADANLQIQLDALNAFQAAVEAADYQAQIDALSQYIESDDSAESIAGLTEQIEAVKTQLEEAIADNTAAIAANATDIATLKETMQAISDALVEINPNLDAITVLVEAGVTSIELVYSYTTQAEAGNPNLVFTNGIEQTNTFGPETENPMEFEAGKLYKKEATLDVRVSPINATLTPEMIRFVNSQGGTLDDIVTVKKVEKNTGTLLTKAEEVGLWTITVEVVDNLAKDDFNAAVQTTVNKETKQVLFAVQANNTLEAYAGRYATSTYDVTFEWKEYDAVYQLWYTVGSTAVDVINNRYYEKMGNSFFDPNSVPAGYDIERRWLVSSDASYDGNKYPTPAVADDSKNDYTTEDGMDDRSNYQLYQGVVGEDIVIKLVDHAAWNDNRGTLTDDNGDDITLKAENIKALYVTLDYEDNAVESAPSEWNAWNSYTYEGLNKVVEGNTITIKVTSAEADGDVIGFRVFAVNYDGTLVDPDGKAFYVLLGDSGTSWSAPATTIVPEYETILDTPSDKVSVSLAKLTDATTSTWVTDKVGSSTEAFELYLLDKNGNELAHTENGELNDLSIDFSAVTQIYTVMNTNAGLAWTNFTDNKAYTGTLTISNSNGRILASLTVTMTKVLPTGVPTNFSIKTGQVVNGIYYGYLVPDNWASGQATTGTMGMTQIFNFFGANEKEDTTILSHYYVDFATSKADSKGAYTETQEVAGNDTLTVDAVLVDNATYHATEVGYNYGKITSAQDSDKNYIEYRVPATTFKSIYVSIYTEDAYTWSWAT
ncbi:MAG: hypothetical protein LUB83_04160, partial [Prevotellaceae bacterium]|nr:hypothetical protein [Prevotellaceae bacterium]